MALDPAAVAAADKEFYARYPERNGKPLQKGEPGFDKMAKEWSAIYKSKSAKPNPKPAQTTSSKVKPAPAFNVGQESTTKVKQECPEPDKKKVKIRITMFFDGTNNNKINIKNGPPSGWKYALSDFDSYSNGVTNIARLSDAWEGYQQTYDISDSLYIEGIGTITGDGDSKVGKGFGTGQAGVEAKVERGLSELVAHIETHPETNCDEVEIEFVELDIFGFSRGAAAARNFVWACLEHESESRRLKNRLQGANKFSSVGEIKFKFAGLYDTVSSFGKSFDDDVEQLHLKSIAKAERVVHLAAADEHRRNFALTNVKSAGGSAVEIYLPGVHSDIGGSYKAGPGEKNVQLMDVDVLFMLPSFYERFQKEKDWLSKSGWFLDDRIKIPTSAFDGGFNELTVSRDYIGHEYSYIPLMLMEKYATDPRFGLKFQNIPQEYSITGDPVLEATKSALDAYVNDKAGPPPTSSGFASKASDWFTHPEPCASQPFLKLLRHWHLHFSAFYGDIGMAPNFVLDGSPPPQVDAESTGIAGGTDSAYQLFGHRERIFHNG